MSSDGFYARLGKAYGEIPSPTRDSYAFDGWFYDSSFQSVVSQEDNADYGARTFYAKWMPIDFENGTHLEITTSSTHREFGIYSATANQSDGYVAVDWGDGSDYEIVNGNLSQKSHEYSSNGTFTIRISDTITELSVAHNSTSDTYTSGVRYCLTRAVRHGTKITKLSDYCYYYGAALTYVDLGANISTIGNYALSGCISVTTIYSRRSQAPSTSQYSFGSSSSSWGGAYNRYCGYTNRNNDTNNLYVPRSNSGYTGNYWTTLTGTNCGFNLNETL